MRPITRELAEKLAARIFAPYLREGLTPRQLREACLWKRMDGFEVSCGKGVFRVDQGSSVYPAQEYELGPILEGIRQLELFP